MKRIIAIVAIMIIILTGCSMFSSGNTADYDENSNELKVPGATIILDGEEYDGEATVSENTMALIVKDDKAYFYSPKQGNVELTVENSAEAVAYYLDEALAEKANNSLNEYESKNQYNSTTGLIINDYERGKYECTNTHERWAGVSLKNNGSRMILKPKTFFDYSFGEMAFGNWSDAVSINEMSAGTLYVYQDDTMNIVGSMIRTALVSTAFPVSQAMFYISKLIHDRDDAYILEDLKNGYQADPELTKMVNAADAIEIITLIAEPIVGASIIDNITSTVLEQVVAEMGEGINTVIANGSSNTEDNIVKYCVKSSIDVLANALISSVPVFGHIAGALKLIISSVSVLAGGAEGVVTDSYDEYGVYGMSASASQYRFKLTWNNDPSDLDLMLDTPNINGTYYTVYFGEHGSLTSEPYAALSVDDTDGYGPEEITISQLFSGTYYLYVYHYSGTGTITESGASIEIYRDGNYVQTIDVPTVYSGSNYYWNVCEIDGSTGNITITNDIVSSHSKTVNLKSK